MGCRPIVRLLLVLSLLWLTPLAAIAQGAARGEAGLPFLRNYTPRDYAAHGQNWALVQDARGVIYAGNNDGVLEFDGARWRLIRTERRTVVRSLAVAADGRIYVGALGEIGVLEPDARGELRYVSLLDRLPEAERTFDDVHHIFVRGEDIYFATYARLIRMRGETIRSWTPKVAFHRAFMARDRLFIRERGRGLMELVDDELRLVPGSEPMAEARVDAVLPWAQRDLLVGSRDSGLHVLGSNGLQPLASDANEVLRRDMLYSGTQLGDGRYALGTFQGGVYFLSREGQLVGRLGKPHGLQDDTVLATLVDRQGGLWLGLDRGLSRVETALPLTRFDERSGLAGGVLALHRHRGQLHAGTTQGVFRLQPGPGARFAPITGMRGQTYAFLSIGDALLAGNNDGTFLIREDTATQLQQGVTGTTTALLASVVVPGRVYVGLWDGLAVLRQEGDRWIDEGRIGGIDLTVSSMFEQADGRLWIGTWNHGVARITLASGTDGRLAVATLERYGESDGLPQLHDNFVQADDGAPLFSTHRGLMRFDAKTRRFVPDPRFATLFGSSTRWVVYGVGAAGPGQLWMQTVDETSGQKEAGLARQTAAGMVWEPQALATISGGWIDKIFVDADEGVAWFGGADGLFRLDALHPPPPTGTFKTLVRQVSSGGPSPVLFAGSGTALPSDVPFAAGTLRVEFSAAYFDSGDGLRYQTRLAGNDPDWSPWSGESFREYTNLHEGRYVLHVRARSRDGITGDEATYVFRVLPPWYRTPWAYLAYLIAAALLVQALLRWRLARIRSEKLALEHVVALRTAELRDKNTQLDHARCRADEERQAAELSRARAEEANRAKTVFLANMSHELRTPLNAVLGFAQLMDRQPQRSSEDRRHLATILRSGEHLLDLINDVLSLSRIEAGVLALDVSAFDLRALIGNVCELMRERAEGKDLWLRTELGPLPKVVNGDARKLSQILLNLLGNAVKFTARGGVTLDARWHEGRATFEVADTGPGIAAHEFDHLFEPFVQTETGRAAKEGTGLGLALSRDMARLMGGDIVARSEVGRGAVFTFSISLPESADGVVSNERGDRRRVQSLAPGQTPPRILVVDDIDDNRTLLCGLLEAVGFEVRQAASGEEALVAWRDWKPHLIWLDKRMPGMDGTEAARRIRDEERRLGRERVVILALSASALEHQRTEILASGCDDFLSKPFREGMIFAKMAEFLGVQYVHEDDGTTPSLAASSGAPAASRLARLPADWQASMQRALAAGDLQQAMDRIAELDATDAELAAELRTLLGSYRLDELDALLATAAASTTAAP
ncbi:MAG TPA: ATP-binding protein [Patescibacteria group bacterium]|nr:ATP-binding protein [Patescibacteria group bacterium]